MTIARYDAASRPDSSASAAMNAAASLRTLASRSSPPLPIGVAEPMLVPGAIPSWSDAAAMKAPAEPAPTEKAEPRSVPKPDVPMIEAAVEREQLSAPGFTLVSTSTSQKPLSGDDVVSMVAMTGVAPAPATVAPSPTEIAPPPTEIAAAEEQWPWMQRRPVVVVATRTAGY